MAEEQLWKRRNDHKIWVIQKSVGYPTGSSRSSTHLTCQREFKSITKGRLITHCRTNICLLGISKRREITSSAKYVFTLRMPKRQGLYIENVTALLYFAFRFWWAFRKAHVHQGNLYPITKMCPTDMETQKAHKLHKAAELHEGWTINSFSVCSQFNAFFHTLCGNLAALE